MANIHISLAGEGRGHATRARTLIDSLRGRHSLTVHTFGAALAFLEPLYRDVADVSVREIPGVTFRYGRSGKVDYARTTLGALGSLRDLARARVRLADELRSSGADAIVTDFEPLLPRAARSAGIPVIAIDHQSVLRYGDFSHLPSDLQRSAVVLGTCVGKWTPRPDVQVSSSFYRPGLRRPGAPVRFVGVLLRDVVRQAQPSTGQHIVAYLRRGTTPEAVDVLRRSPHEVRLYGLGSEFGGGSVVPRPISEQGFVDDLASCRALVTTAGNQLIGEAIHLGKPILALPEPGNREQEINAWFLDACGAGLSLPCPRLTIASLRSFLGSRERYRSAARALDVDGTAAALEIIDSHLRHARQQPPVIGQRRATLFNA